MIAGLLAIWFRLVVVVVIVMVAICVVAMPVKAQIATPTRFTVDKLEAYRGVIEADDQLYLISFTIDYTTNPDEDAGEAWLIRLLDENDNQLAVVAPIPFVDDGYDAGIRGIYFNANDAPAWQGNFSVELSGNPSLTWVDGDPPTTTNDVFDVFSDTPENVAPRIRVVAVALEGIYSLDMVELIQGVNQLTSTGEGYFEDAIPNLRVIAPGVFQAGTVVPDFDEKTFTQTEATAAEGRWTDGSIFDLSGLATLLGGVSRMWLTSALYIGFSIAVLIFLSRWIGSTRPSLFLFGAMMILGSFMGFMVFEAAIMAGVAGGLALVWALMWRTSP